jgi:hypothetical protein
MHGKKRSLACVGESSAKKVCGVIREKILDNLEEFSSMESGRGRDCVGKNLHQHVLVSAFSVEVLPRESQEPVDGVLKF